MRRFHKVRDAVSKLTPEHFRVTQHAATEQPGSGAYLHHKEPGFYVGIVSGEPQLASTNRLNSGSGWPSFTRPLESDCVRERRDPREGASEVRCTRGDSQLGHVFCDGPPNSGGLRYCSAALRFIHRDDTEANGYGAYLTYGNAGDAR